jgi:hypothetical protein
MDGEEMIQWETIRYEQGTQDSKAMQGIMEDEI